MTSAARARSKPKPAPGSSKGSSGERLHKVLAAAGVGSRRECEELIQAGRVEVERSVVTELGVKVDPSCQKIRVDGQLIRQPKCVYYVLNKPPGVICTNRDPDGRVRVIDLIRSDLRLFPVGRLDKSSEGLILATNDGELANRLTHPRYGVAKTYLALVAGRPGQDKLSKLRRGIHLAEGRAQVASVKVKRRRPHSTELEIVLREGRNREIRRLLARIGHKVLHLKRVAIGPLRLGDLPSGAHRRLTRDEVRRLQRCVEPRERAGDSDTSAGPRRRRTATTRKPARGKVGASRKNRTRERP